MNKILLSAYELVNPGKMFTCLYNKFRPLNRMHYMKCGANSSLLNSGCCRRSVGPWINVVSRHTVFTKTMIYTNLLLCDILRNKAPRTGPHHIWCTYTLCPFFGHEKNTGSSAVGLISLASVCYSDFC